MRPYRAGAQVGHRGVSHPSAHIARPAAHSPLARLLALLTARKTQHACEARSDVQGWKEALAAGLPPIAERQKWTPHRIPVAAGILPIQGNLARVGFWAQRASCSPAPLGSQALSHPRHAQRRALSIVSRAHSQRLGPRQAPCGCAAAPSCLACAPAPHLPHSISSISSSGLSEH